MDDSQYATIDEIKNFSPALKHKIVQAEAAKKKVSSPIAPPAPAVQLEYLQEEQPPPLPPLPPPSNRQHSQKTSSPPQLRANGRLPEQKTSSPPQLRANGRLPEQKEGDGSSVVLKVNSMDVEAEAKQPALRPKAGEYLAS